jgi:hypothetical protein
LVNSEASKLKAFFGLSTGDYDFAELTAIFQSKLIIFVQKKSYPQRDLFFSEISAILEEIQDFVDVVDYFGFARLTLKRPEIEDFSNRSAIILVSCLILYPND